MIKIGICDDDASVYDLIRESLTKYAIYMNQEIEFYYYATAQEVLDAEDDGYILLFLDIMLDQDNDGISIGRELRRKGNSALFVITTSRQDRFQDAYTATVFRYLLKPIKQDELYRVMTEALEYLNMNQRTFFVKFKYETRHVRISDIVYIESYMRKRYITTKSEKLPTTETWESILKDLEFETCFFRPKKTYLINLMNVASHSPAGVRMVDGTEISFEKGRYELFLKHLDGYLKKWG